MGDLPDRRFGERRANIRDAKTFARFFAARRAFSYGFAKSSISKAGLSHDLGPFAGIAAAGAAAESAPAQHRYAMRSN